MRLLFSILVGVMFATTALAAPIISNVSGTIAHNSSVTISGSGFGASTSPPLVWDNCSGTDPLALWTDATPNTWNQVGVSSTYQIGYRTPSQVTTGRGAGTGEALPHSHTTKYLAGAHYSPSTAGAYGDVMVWKNKTISSLPAYTYASWYTRLDHSWAFTPSGQGTNHKFFVIGYGYPFDPNTWYLQYLAGNFSSASATVYHNIGDDDGNTYWQNPSSCSSCYGQSDPCDIAGKCVGPWGPNPPWTQTSDDGTTKQTAINPTTGWIKREVEIKHASDNTGFVKVYENGIQRYFYTGRNVPTSQGLPYTMAVALESYSDVWGSGQSNNWRYMADMYMDNSLQRVLICSGSTYVTRGNCEIQPPISRTSSSITVSINQGAHPDSSTRYLYVVDDAGIPNSSGTSVTFGVGESDTIAPTITAFTMPSTSTSLTVSVSSFTATDDTGVTGYCLTETNNSATCSWVGSAPTSYTFATSGSKTLYAFARDAVPNVSTSLSANVTITLPSASLSGAKLSGAQIRP